MSLGRDRCFTYFQTGLERDEKLGFSTLVERTLVDFIERAAANLNAACRVELNYTCRGNKDYALKMK